MKAKVLIPFIVALSTVVFLGCPNPESPVTEVPITLLAIPGVTAPETGATPVTSLSASQYTGTIAWNGSPVTFAASTVYTATITLSPKTGYTLAGVTANSFTVASATSVTNSVDSGVVTAVFPSTSSESNDVFGTVTVSSSATEVTVSFPGKDMASTEYSYAIYLSTDNTFDDSDSYQILDATSSSGYEYTFTGLDPNTQYYVEVEFSQLFNPSATEVYTVPVKTAIQYGNPLAPTVTIKRSEATTDLVRLNFTAPSKDSLGNDITVAGYNVTVDGVQHYTTDAYYDLVREGDTFSSSQDEPDYESVSVRAVANETTNTGAATSINAYTLFSSKYEEWYFKLYCISSLLSDSVYADIAAEADSEMTALLADSDHTDANILAHYALNGYSDTEVYNAMTQHFTIDSTGKTRAYMNSAADVDPTDISSTYSIITASLMPKQMPVQGIFENFDAYKAAKLALMPMSQQQALLKAKVQTEKKGEPQLICGSSFVETNVTLDSMWDSKSLFSMSKIVKSTAITNLFYRLKILEQMNKLMMIL